MKQHRVKVDLKVLRTQWGKMKLDVLATQLGTTSKTLVERAKALGLPLLAPQRGKRLDRATKDAIDADLRAGMATLAVAEKHDVHYSTVRKARTRVLGRQRKHRRWNRSRLAIACAQGMTIAEVAAACRCCYGTMRQVLKRFGLKCKRVDRRIKISRAAFVQDWRDGMPFRQMARKHGFKSVHGVKTRLRREGVPVDRQAVSA
jgi:hypothetical protein